SSSDDSASRSPRGADALTRRRLTKRQTIMTGDLPVKSLHFPDLADTPVGERGLLYGLGDDAVFAIDHADHSVKLLGRSPALTTAHGFCVTRGGDLYFGAGARLKQAKLP